MTQVAAIAMSLLKGEVLSIMNGFQMFSCTNLPRELSRGIEAKFGVEISRDKVVFKSKYGQPGFYYRYRLNRTAANAPGIAKMKEYVQSQLPAAKEGRTPAEQTKFRQQELFIKSL